MKELTPEQIAMDKRLVEGTPLDIDEPVTTARSNNSQVASLNAGTPPSDQLHSLTGRDPPTTNSSEVASAAGQQNPSPEAVSQKEANPRARTKEVPLLRDPLTGCPVELVENAQIDWCKPAINPTSSTNSTTHLTFEDLLPADSILTDYAEYAVTQTEAADSYIAGAILPVVGAILERKVWIPWPNGQLFPNLYTMLVGPPGNLKTTTVELAEALAREILDPHHFLPHNYSPESLFDAYYKNPYRLLICDDANATIIRWQNPNDGERLSSNFLTLFDGKPLSEGFRRNRKQDDLESQERWTPPTSTNIVFGATFLGCHFKENASRLGLQRRFLYYVAEDTVRSLLRPEPDFVRFKGLISQFTLLSRLRGVFTWTREAEQLFDRYKIEIDRRKRACDILDEFTRSRLTTACALVVKLAMIFEASCLCYDAKWMPNDSEIVPDSPPLILKSNIVELAINHVDACLKAAASLDSIANRGRIAEEAQILLARIRKDFQGQAHSGSIILTRSQITQAFAHHANRRGSPHINDIYHKQIPYLIQIGEAKLLSKEGKKEIYAFRVED
jgi:hypothetical protein